MFKYLLQTLFKTKKSPTTWRQAFAQSKEAPHSVYPELTKELKNKY